MDNPNEYTNWMYDLGVNENGNVVGIIGNQKIEITEKDVRRISHLFEMERLKKGATHND